MGRGDTAGNAVSPSCRDGDEIIGIARFKFQKRVPRRGISGFGCVELSGKVPIRQLIFQSLGRDFGVDSSGATAEVDD